MKRTCLQAAMSDLVFVVLGNSSKDEFAVLMSVNEGQECSQDLWGIVLLILIAPHPEKCTQTQFFTGSSLERL